MTLNELEQIVEEGESVHLEFKRRVPERDKLMREAIALSNAKGGVILIGVDDDGAIYGLKDPLEADFEFESSVNTLCRPPLEYSIEHIPVTRKRTVVLIRIPESRNKPHVLLPRPGAKKGTALYRIRDKSVTASRELFHILRFRQKDRGVKFEFGDKERLLMEYLDEHAQITVEEFARLAGISTYRASRTLVLLVRANVLDIQPQERQDKFSLVEKY